MTKTRVILTDGYPTIVEYGIIIIDPDTLEETVDYDIPKIASPRTSALLVSTENLNVTYDSNLNTLTSNINTALILDTVAVPLLGRILIISQINYFQNGIYVLTSLGDNSNPYVLTRAEDANTPELLKKGILIEVEKGRSNSGSVWILTSNTPANFTSDRILFNRFSKFFSPSLDTLPITLDRVFNENLSGVKNMSNTNFTTANNYVSQTISIFCNGMRQYINIDYTEVAPNGIDFIEAPYPDDLIIVNYDKAI